METTVSVEKVIGDAYKEWRKSTPVIICAPTGTGKTTFILNTLLPYAQANHQKVCYMSNRRMLKRQVENNVPSEFQNSITTINYQATISEIREAVESATYWVFDEAHFFLADASFNTRMDELIKYIERALANHICIFMTATPEYLFLFFLSLHNCHLFYGITTLPEPYYLSIGGIHDAVVSRFMSAKQLLTYKEVPNEMLTQFSYQEWNGKWHLIEDQFQSYYRHRFSEVMGNYSERFDQVRKRCDVYEIDRDYSYVLPCYYRDNRELIDMVVHTPQNEKWLIFVSAKAIGHQIKEELLKAGIFEVAFLDSRGSDPDGKKARESIVANSFFPQRILICTKVLDNGTNISDPAVKHIAIIKADETTFLQMLGRKRINRSKGETITLYIKHEASSVMQKYFNQKYLSILRFIHDFLDKKEIHSSWNGNYNYYSKDSGIIGKKYAENGQFKSPYKNYVQQESSMQEAFQRLSQRESYAAANVDRVMIEAYKIREIPKQQAVYEYYKMLAMFENFQNKEYLAEQRDEIVEDTMWLEEQLRWLGLSFDPLRWNTVVFRTQQIQRTQLEGFLDSHQGILTLQYEQKLKDLVLSYLSTLRPEPKEAHSKASFRTVQSVLERYHFPYKLTKKRSSKNGKDRFWWEISELI